MVTRTRSTRALPKLEEWIARQHRFTALWSGDEPNTDWSLFTSEAPDHIIDSPAKGTKVTKRTSGATEIVHQLQPGRLDVIFRVSPKHEAECSDPLSHLGPFVESSDQFHEFIRGWINSSPCVNRIALGGQAALPVSNHASAYGALEKLLPDVQVDFRTVTDLKFSVNRRRDNGQRIRGLKINRLATWNAVRRQMMLLQLSESGPEPIASPRSEAFYVQIEYDINTSGMHQPQLPIKKLSALIDELRSLVDFAVANGDRDAPSRGKK